MTRRGFLFNLGLACVLSACAPPPADRPPARKAAAGKREASALPPAPVPKEPALPVAELIARLDAQDYGVREAATRALIGMGKSVVPQLERALRLRREAEVRSRLRRVLQELSALSPEEEYLRARDIVRTWRGGENEKLRRALAHLDRAFEGAEKAGAEKLIVKIQALRYFCLKQQTLGVR